MKKILEKKLLIGVITGFVLSFGIAAMAQVNDSWNIGEGWLWFTETSGGDVRANVEGPIEDTNVANKEYVHAALSESGGGGGIVCTQDQKTYSPNYASSYSSAPYFVCCMPNVDGTDMICVSGLGLEFWMRYVVEDNLQTSVIDGS